MKTLTTEEAQERWGATITETDGGRIWFVEIEDAEGRWVPVYDDAFKWHGYRLAHPKPPPAVIGQPIPWASALPLIRALRDIAQQSDDWAAAETATMALHEVFPDARGLNILFGRTDLEPVEPDAVRKIHGDDVAPVHGKS